MISQWIDKHNIKVVVPVKNKMNSLDNNYKTVDQGTQSFEIESEQKVYYDPKHHLVKTQCPHSPKTFSQKID